MITQVKIPIVAREEVRILPEFAYSLYGEWMRLLEPDQADKLHEQRLLNQYLNLTGRNSAQLTVNLLTDEVAEWMIPVFQKKHDYFLTKFGCELTAGEPQIHAFGEDTIVKPFLTTQKVQNHIILHFLTPTTFKSGGRYAVFPTPELILHSAATKWNTLNFSVSAEDQEAINLMEKSTVITSYRLSSAYYGIKETRIQSFTGNLTLSIRAPEPVIRLFDMLLNGLKFTGLGIKTSLGMGGIDTAVIR